MAWINKPKNNTMTDRKAERQKIYNTKRWRDLRILKLQQSPVCEICGSIDNLQVHHIVSPFNGYHSPEEYDRLAYDITNLQTLCQQCHEKIHGKKVD